MSGFVTDEDRKFVETWESCSQSLIFVIKFGPMGEHVYEQVHGQRKFAITTAERLVTQSKIADEKNDPFTNGQFRPVVVPATVNVETNPNALSDSDIFQIFKASNVAWDAYMDVLDAPATIRRMLDLAEKEESEISFRRVRQLQERLDVLQPRQNARQKDADLLNGISGPSNSGPPPQSSPPKGRGAKAPATGSSHAAG